jgi:hypothetical protein
MEARGRSHWDAVKQAFAVDELQRNLDAAQLTAEERVLLGLRMGAATPATLAGEREFEQCGIAKAQLHVRWRELQARRGRDA